MARYRPIAEQFRIAKQVTIEETRKVAIAVAKAEHARVLGQPPRPTGFTRFVDGVEGAKEEAIKPNGVIVYEYRRLDEVVAFALATLRDRSPLGPPERGHYREAHQLFLNGSPVATIDGWKSGDEILIGNLMPYARKIEVGRMQMTVPGTNLVYAQADQIVSAKYGSVARIAATFREIAGTRVPVLLIREF